MTIKSRSWCSVSERYLVKKKRLEIAVSRVANDLGENAKYFYFGSTSCRSPFAIHRLFWDIHVALTLFWPPMIDVELKFELRDWERVNRHSKPKFRCLHKIKEESK